MERPARNAVAVEMQAPITNALYPTVALEARRLRARAAARQEALARSDWPA